MLEESITSSPPKQNRSIHKARIHRKNKRSTQNLEEKNASVQEFMPSLADLYWEDRTLDNSSNLNVTYNVRQVRPDFDPFEDELLLAMADQLDCAQIKTSYSQFANVKIGQGFASCSQLFDKNSVTDEVTDVQSINIPVSRSSEIAAIEIAKTSDVKKLNARTSPQIVAITSGPKTQFGVTESELLQFCHNAESTTEELKTPQLKKNKSIVESILEDFCSSPDGRQEQPLEPAAAADGTPVFRHKNIRTYARRRRVEFSNLNGVENTKPLSRMEEDDAISNCSSGLSVQEDLTQPLECSVKSVDLNNIKLCENLLNLSAYFTQLPVDVESSPDVSASVNSTYNEEFLESTVVMINQLIEEIITLRKQFGSFKKGCTDSLNDESFYGFAIYQHEENPKIPENCDALQISEAMNELANVGNAERDNTPKLDEEIFSENEDDCDFFKNFKTQDALHKNDETKNLEYPCFMSASRKPIKISEIAKKRGACILGDINIEEVDQSSIEALKKIGISAKAQQQSKLRVNNLENTDKIKQNSESITENSTEEKLSAPHTNLIDADLVNMQLSEWPIDDQSLQDKCSTSVTKSEFKGLQTVRNKCINTSVAKSTNTQLLENLPDSPNVYIPENSDAQQLLGVANQLANVKKCGKASELNDDLFSENEEEWTDDCDFFKNFKTQDAFHKNDETKTVQYPGFMSASRKPIETSETAKKRVACIFGNINMGEVDQSSIDALKNIKMSTKAQKHSKIRLNNVENTDDNLKQNLDVTKPVKYPGFMSASRKPIRTSEIAKKRVACIFGGINMGEVDQSSIDALKNIKISTKGQNQAKVRLKNFEKTDNNSKENLELLNDIKIEHKLSALQTNFIDADLANIQLSEWPVYDDHPMTDECNTSVTKTEFKDFPTSSTKCIKITDDAKLRTPQLLKNLPVVPNKLTSSSAQLNGAESHNQLKTEGISETENIKIIKNAQFRAAKLENIPETLASKANISIEKKPKDTKPSEYPSNSEIKTIAEKSRNIFPLLNKRKLEPQTCDPEEQVAKILCKSYSTNDVIRSPLTTPRTENCLPKSASFGPLSKNTSVSRFAKSELIARKNLLSLSKRRKVKTSQEINKQNVTDNIATTPLKTECHASNNTTPGTPNLNEFMQCIPDSSTPRTTKLNCFKNVQQQQSKVKEIDSDFQQIKWEECNELIGKDTTVLNSNLSSTKLSDNSNENVTLNASKPSPKQRIGRLSMYGKPPTVSPIIMLSKCRTLGLRRGRSMNKK